MSTLFVFIWTENVQYKVRNFLPEISAKIFFLKIDILRAKVYTKNVPNLELCKFIPAPL